MNIKDILDKISNRKKCEESNEAIVSSEENAITFADSDVPKVIFDDLELQVTIGQWLGILSSSVGYGNAGFTIYTHLDANDLMKRLHIPQEDFQKIAHKFGVLLKSIGVDSSEVCTLSQFNKDKFSFNCHFANTGKDAFMSATWGDWIDFGPELTIRSGNQSKTYDYVNEYEERPASLHLQHSTIKNPDNGSSCFRFMSPYSVCMTLENGDYTLKIEADRPKNNKVDLFNADDFKLKNEDELQQYLLGLTFPIDIGEVYKKVCKLSIDSIYDFPSFKLKVEVADGENKKKVTDMISLSNGNLDKFVLTRDGRTVAIDGDDNWSFGSQTLNVSQQDGAVDYSLKAIPKESFLTTLTPLEQFTEAKEEVQKAKVYAKTMLTGDNN